MRMLVSTLASGVSLSLCGLAMSAADAGQIDPLMPLRRVPPNVVIVLDTSAPMLEDAARNYFDPKTYRRDDDPGVAAALGVVSATYRRVYRGLRIDPVVTADRKYEASDIGAVSSGTAAYESFWAATRLEIAKAGLALAVGDHPAAVRWGLVKLRQNRPAWRDPAAAAGCDGPVRVTDSAALAAAWDAAPCATGSATTPNRYALYVPSTDGPSFQVTAAGSDALVVGVGAADATSRVLDALRGAVGSGSLIPAGRDTAAYTDRPLALALEDARTHVAATMASDDLRECRNTVVILIAGGGDDGDAAYRGSVNAVATAAAFSAVAGGGQTRRVPLVVVGVGVDAGARAQLEAVASAGEGRYFAAASAADVARAVSFAVQLGFAKASDVDARRGSEFAEGVVVGTVDLAQADDASGAPLPDTAIVATRGTAAGAEVPQRSNVLVTTGYTLPGFEGGVRAFRVYRPEAAADAPAGWRFVRDGTRLWPNLDDRPELAGRARAPAAPASRNIYTYIPDGTGGGRVVAFVESERATLAPHLGAGSADADALIQFVRAQPIGAVISSTPAILDPPSLDPPPDADYGRFDRPGSFAAMHRRRRALIFVGANDGMLHAIDARSGYEVWAFIPYNLLPKLHLLMRGQSAERFNYFVDGSPKIAEVKIAGAWRTLLVVGQGYGGTFYTAFDVTEAGSGVDAAAPGWAGVAGLLARFDAPNESITFLWAFPNFSSFDPAIRFDADVGSGMPGGRIALLGDLKAAATEVEKRVGFSFSTPAIGPLSEDRSVSAVIVGSGHFPAVEGLLAGRAGVPAGRSLFLLDAVTGLPLGAPAGASCAGVGCFDLGETPNGRRNALQGDVVAAGREGSAVFESAYAGDADGRLWRFSFGADGVVSGISIVDAGQPIYSAAAVAAEGPARRMVFFATGSALLPASAPGGGSGAGTAFALFGVRDDVGAGGGAAVLFRRELSPQVMSAGPPSNGERPAGAPAIAAGVLFLTTVTGATSAVCIDDTTRAYGVTFSGGAAYDTNGDGRTGAADSPVFSTIPGRGSAMFVADRHLFLAATSRQGAEVALFGEPREFNTGLGAGVVRVLSWREIR